MVIQKCDLSITCPLCSNKENELYYDGDKRDNYRKYYKCNNCNLIFVHKKDLLSKSDEKNRYDEHNNDINDEGYRKFLEKLYIEIKPLLSKDMSGLDYGCGPGPLLYLMLKEDGYKFEKYDPFYFDNKALLNYKYDFITSTEVFEHFYNPLKEIEKLDGILKDKGILAIMTYMTDELYDFSKWNYKNDLTHVVFYCEKTIKWISNNFNWDYNIPNGNIVIFTKK